MSEQLAPQPETTFHFVLCEHTLENSAEIASSLSGCDIIAFESVGGSQGLKSIVGELLSEYVASSTTAQRRHEIGTDYLNSEGWQIAVLNNLLATDKKVVLIDAAEEDLENTLAEEAQAARERYLNSISQQAPPFELERVLRHSLLTNGVSSMFRERLVARQLERLAADNPGERIGVVIGAVHTGVQHEMDRKFATDRRFVYPKGVFNSGLAKINYAPAHMVERKLNLTKLKELGNRDVKEVLLHDLLFIKYDIRASNTELSELSDDDINSLIAQIEADNSMNDEKILLG